MSFKTLAAMWNDLQKSVREASQLEEIQKAYDSQQTIIAEVVETVKTIAKNSQPRKSLGTYVALEKSATKEVNVEEAITAKMDAGMSYAKARTEVLTSLGE